MNTQTQELIVWQSLNKKWQKSKFAMLEAENLLDAKVTTFLNHKGLRPDQVLLERVDQLRQEEDEARDELESFITELL